MLEIFEESNIYTGMIDGQITTYCEMVEKGCKPLAFFNLKNRYVKAVKDYIQKCELYCYIKNSKEYPEWTTIYIYKYKWFINIIKNLPDEPQTIFDHWIIGKACGYSNEAINEFINKI
jgi:hypothetical protein